VIPHGSPEQIAEAVGAHVDAGADHVCMQPIGHAYPPVDHYRSLARALIA
jgi:alkanesulfonate monooxygenase SsuD/methylene tetrahydromethanopterin reductase-like flavin-dependent oxidoreductase (luciferase family)